MPDFSRRYGRWAVVTGGAQGVGLAFGDALLERGCSVVLVDRQPEVRDVAAARGDARYMDTNAAGGWVWNIDERQTKANASGPMTQDVSEVLVAESLWDIADAPDLADDDDPLGSRGHADVIAVVVGYVASGARGRSSSGRPGWPMKMKPAMRSPGAQKAARTCSE